MQLLGILLVFCGYILWTQAQLPLNGTQEILSRRRRYVAFPEGSSLSAAICMTIGVIGNPHVSYLSWAVNWGVAYNLPNSAWALKHAQGFANTTKAVVQRRSRRDLYEKLELAIDNMGFPGRACISRTLCESVKFVRGLRNRKGNMVEEIIKTIFRFPSAQLQSDEPDEHHHYARVYSRSKRMQSDCAEEYADCQFSILDLVLGNYGMVSSSKIRPSIVFM